MGEEERGGVNHQPRLETDQSFWDNFLDSPDLSLPKFWEATPADLSGPPGVQSFGEQSLGTLRYYKEDEKKLKKRKIDRYYRERIKIKKQKLADEEEELDGKIDGLKIEIVSYQRDIDFMTQDLQTKAAERRDLRPSIDKLKYEVSKRKEFMSRLCCKPSIQKDVLGFPGQLQIALLKNVHAILDQNYNWEYERKGLEEEIAKLEGDNKMLQVQHQALLECANEALKVDDDEATLIDKELGGHQLDESENDT